jgi:hypothetical protein
MWSQLLADERIRQQGVAALASQVAELSLDSLVRAVGDATRGMSVHEARGYVRGRSSAEIRRLAQTMVARRPQTDVSWTEHVCRQATDRAVSLVLRRLNQLGAFERHPRRQAA